MKKAMEHIASFTYRYLFRVGGGLLLLLLWLFCLPSPLFTTPTSTVVESRTGELLGARIADDGQWRFPKIDSVPYRFEQCLLYFEDEYFYQHPGFNPVSMTKALWQNMTTESRRGGSTLTQQVIRLSRKENRTYWEKVIELFQATRLEAGSSKEEILQLYASQAPFGGNVVGLETAAWRYFGIPASELSWGQSAALAVLPNAPALVYPGKNETIFRKKRDALLLKLFEKGIIAEDTYELALDERLPGTPVPLPDMAYHFTEKVRKEHNGQRLKSTIDMQLQEKVNRLVFEHHAQLKQNEIHNMAVLVLDVETKEVLAYIGNAPTSKDNNPFVDIIDKPRSTGSVLKPFLFASLMDSGELLPDMLVADVPTVINGYSPENFDQRYHGAVPAGEALSRSLNVPAARMLREYGLQRFHHKLELLQFQQIDKPANYYGLSLILGGAESSLWEITSAYAGMASTLNYFNSTSSEYRKNDFRKPTYSLTEPFTSKEKTTDPPVLDAGAIYKTFEALREVNRPLGEENWQFFSSAQPIAWKTGTSFGFKDAWAVGVTSKYAVGVWVGNADGEGRPGLTGIQAAAPVLFDVFQTLPASDWFATPYDELVETKVCTESGHLAGVSCIETISEFIPKKGIRTAPCPYHNTVFTDTAGGYRVNSSCYSLAEMKQRSWFSLPPVMEYYYAPLHPEYKPLPPYRSDCLKEGEKVMEFIFPKQNETILLAKNFEENIQETIFQLAHRNTETSVYWYWDDTFLNTTTTFHEIALLPKPGPHVLTVVDSEGNRLQQTVRVQATSEL
ncbi:penicillin-binding protein 1C [Flavobacteriaceae bacterium TK19130]|nr:penicillin-binding protein 1C [Thermobacterium salinum]